MKQSLLQETNKTNPTRRMKPAYRAEQLHNQSTPMEEMLSTNEQNVPRRWNMPTDSLLECGAIHKSNVSTKMNNLQMRTIAYCEVHLRSRPSHFQRSTGTAETTREDTRWKIWDELRASGSTAIIQNYRACRTVTMVRTPAFRETEVSIQKPVYGQRIWCAYYLV